MCIPALQIVIWRTAQQCLGSPSGGAVERSETERALSAPYEGTSPKGRGKGGCAANLTNTNLSKRLRTGNRGRG